MVELIQASVSVVRVQGEMDMEGQPRQSAHSLSVCVHGDVYMWRGGMHSYVRIRGDLPRLRLSLAQNSKEVNKGNYWISRDLKNYKCLTGKEYNVRIFKS